MTTEITPFTVASYHSPDKQRGALKTKRDEIDPAERLPKPNWIRVKAGSSERFREIKDIVRAHDVNMLTIGQYLQPSGGHMPVRRSYHADQQAHAAGVF